MKVVIVVLVLVAVLFAVGLGLGFRDEPPREQQKRKAEDGEHPGWMDMLLKPAQEKMPKVRLFRKGVEVRRIDVPCEPFVIPKAENDEPYRMLKLKWVAGAPVKVSFDSKGEVKMKDLDDPQEFTLAGEENKRERRYVRSAVTIFKGGGTLTLMAEGLNQKGVVEVE